MHSYVLPRWRKYSFAVCSQVVLFVDGLSLTGLGLDSALKRIGTSRAEEASRFSPAHRTTEFLAITSDGTYSTQRNPTSDKCVGQSFAGTPIRPKLEECFCLWAGQCLDRCEHDQSVDDCQVARCQRKPLAMDSASASFYSKLGDFDLVTIPRAYYHDLSALSADCGQAEVLVAKLLSTARSVFEKHNKLPATYQCFHLPGELSVGWLHLHTFANVSAMLQSKELFIHPAETSMIAQSLQSCVSADMSVEEAAKAMLKTSSICMAASTAVPDPQYLVGFPNHKRCKENDADPFNTSAFPVGGLCTPVCEEGYTPDPPTMNCSSGDVGYFKGVKTKWFNCIKT